MQSSESVLTILMVDSIGFRSDGSLEMIVIS